jgi:hypothetical protein
MCDARIGGCACVFEVFCKRPAKVPLADSIGCRVPFALFPKKGIAMNYNEAKAVVAAGRHLPGHLAWLVQEAQRVVLHVQMDVDWCFRDNMPVVSPQEWEQANMAFAARLARACRKRDWLWADMPQPIKVRRVIGDGAVGHLLPPGEKTEMLGVGA